MGNNKAEQYFALAQKADHMIYEIINRTEIKDIVCTNYIASIFKESQNFVFLNRDKLYGMYLDTNIWFSGKLKYDDTYLYARNGDILGKIMEKNEFHEILEYLNYIRRNYNANDDNY
jgi:hypothetical protein